MQAQGVRDIIDLQEYFVGQDYGNGKFSCMHGPGECVGDQLELCAYHYYNTTWAWWDFGVCLQGSSYGSIPANAQECAQKANVDYSKLSSCQQGSLGAMLFSKSIAMANQAGVYATPTTFIAGKEYVGGSNNPLQTICNAYTGTKPAGCSGADSLPTVSAGFKHVSLVRSA